MQRIVRVIGKLVAVVISNSYIGGSLDEWCTVACAL